MQVPIPAGASAWQAQDYTGAVVGTGNIEAGQSMLSLGRLDVGWYRVEFTGDLDERAKWTTAGVVAKWTTPVPIDSPVCVDSATAWFAQRYDDEQQHQEILANLAALAGASWIRDRLTWEQLEPARGQFAAAETCYDSSAQLAARHGLQVLQVFHHTPRWATDSKLDGPGAGSRFPRDLRDAFQFCRAMAIRMDHQVSAWEPWNEANITVFGGHPIDEMCSLQKAAYLGYKAGDADLRVCWNVYAGSGSTLHSEGVLANEAWPYFETYNIHSYAAPSQYVQGMDTARQAACGRPLWLTECGIRLPTDDAAPWGDLAPENERKQAEFVAQSFATSLYAGVERHFFFILGNYIERGIQFGILRHDHTPRPAYLALAAVGRFLAGGKCLGRVSPTVCAFRATPDGVEQDVLVAWGAGEASPWPADLRVNEAYDLLGRSLGKQVPRTLQPAAVFLLLPPGEADRLELAKPPACAPWRDGEPTSIVLQLSMPADAARLATQSYEVEPGVRTDLPLLVYNFGPRPVTGRLSVEQAPANWQVQVDAEPMQIQPLDRLVVPASVTLPASGRELLAGQWVKLRGDFGEAGRPVLAFRLTPDLLQLQPERVLPIPAAAEPTSWQDNVVPQASMSHRAGADGQVLFDIQFSSTDPWAYPRLNLTPECVPDNRDDGLMLRACLLEGTGSVRVQLIEQSGAAYLGEVAIDPDRREPQQAVVLFRHCKWQSHSTPDPDGRLRPADIRAILVGLNGRQNTEVTLAVSDLQWIRY